MLGASKASWATGSSHPGTGRKHSGKENDITPGFNLPSLGQKGPCAAAVPPHGHGLVGRAELPMSLAGVSLGCMSGGRVGGGRAAHRGQVGAGWRRLGVGEGGWKRSWGGGRQAGGRRVAAGGRVERCGGRAGAGAQKLAAAGAVVDFPVSGSRARAWRRE